MCRPAISSGGQKKLLELGRVMMLRPRLILLDEPFAGVNAVLITEIMDRIRELHAQGIGFLIIEHDLESLSDLVGEMHVLDQGALLASGAPRTRAQRPARPRRLSRGQCAMTVVLSVAGLRGGYTEVEILKGVDLRWRKTTSSPSPERTAPANRHWPRRLSAFCRMSPAISWSTRARLPRSRRSGARVLASDTCRRSRMSSAA